MSFRALLGLAVILCGVLVWPVQVDRADVAIAVGLIITGIIIAAGKSLDRPVT